MKTLRISSIFVLLGALLASLFISCTYSTSTSVENRESKVVLHQMEDFHSIILKGGYDITLKQADEHLVKVNGESKLHNRTDIYVHDGVLYMTMKNSEITTDSRMKVDISFKELSKLSIEGGLALSTEGFIQSTDFDMRIQGGANTHLKIKADRITAKGEGGVNMRFEGVCDTFTASTEGAGNIDAIQLKARIVDCRVAGVGNASVYATDELFAQVEGIGRINYRGNPLVHKNVQGIGVVHRK